ncbi:MAG: bifunctional DNA-binding transcriptional regulator/O6-methylguanine-DNA methyltransferase Ada [Thermoanaerobaculia bacterium]
MLDEEQCWQAVLRRDRGRDGRFYFGVKTTGVFCRPSCAARRPLRKNVGFYRTAEEAERAGLRPCRRCHPLDRSEDSRVDQIRELCDYIRRHSDSGDPLTLEVLGRQVGLSPSRLRRVFREIVGVTPRQYVEACRFEALKRGLRDGDSVTDAIYDAGFGTSSRVYEQADTRLGMTPGEYRAGGRDLAISYAFADTPVGKMLVAATDRGLCCVRFGDSAGELLEELHYEYPAATIEEMSAGGADQFGLWVDALKRHLEGAEPHLDLPLDVRASAFQLRVWKYLQSISYGETRSYSQVARAIGKPKAVRAVAGACAANRTAIAIPCHRVIRADGELGGYRWGRERKQRLLERERR